MTFYVNALFAHEMRNRSLLQAVGLHSGLIAFNYFILTASLQICFTVHCDRLTKQSKPKAAQLVKD